MTSGRAVRRAETVHEANQRRTAQQLRRTLNETQEQQRNLRLGKTARLLAAATDAHTHQLAAALTTKEPGTAGRPAAHPDWCLVLYGMARSIYGSSLAVSVELRDPHTWQHVKAAVAETFGTDYITNVPDTAPTRSQWNYWQAKIRRTRQYAKLADQFREQARTRSLDMGMFDAADDFDIAHIHRDHIITSDGKVSTAPSKHQANTTYDTVDKTTGEITTKTRRADSNSALWPEAGEDSMHMEWGCKATYLSARLPQYGTRVILDLAVLRPGDSGGEARDTVTMTLALKEQLPGLHALVVDGVLRGTHIDPLMRSDLIVVNKPQQGPRRATGSVRINGRWEKSQLILTERKRSRSGTCRHVIYAIGGDLYEAKTTDTGTEDYIHLTQRTVRRKRSRTVTWYKHMEVSCSRCGGFSKHVPITSQANDTFNRSEYIRQISPANADFPRVYGMRPDSESLNNTTEQAWHLRRIPNYGYDNQALCLLLHSQQQNSDAWAVHLKRLHQNNQAGPPALPEEEAA